ncbi:MAG TPA: S8 family serine peptidase [Thermoanaerobaculia bacterium]|nr:S8 family serine peptidase [Thermoanaerobaculia bacterium]
MRVSSKLSVLAFLVAFAIPLVAGPPDRALAPRRAANKQAARLPLETVVETVILKFHEGTHVRLRGRKLAALERDARENSKLAGLDLTPSQVESDLRAVHALLASNKLVRGLDRLYTIAEDDLAAWRASGEERSGQELADLDLYYAVEIPDRTTQADVNLLVDILNTIPSIEVAYATAPPEVAAADIPPTTPNFQPSQGYLNAAPNGINALYAWTIPGGRGSGTKIVDIEWAWRTTHEDLPPMFYTSGTQSGSRNHGTAVMGVMVGVNNAYGVTGIAHQAQIGYRAAGSSRTMASAMTSASMAVGVSGLVLIEMHWPGPSTPSTSCSCNTSQCDYIPMEYWQDNFDAIASAVANGRIVVEAGGNGSTNLDDPVYGGAFNRMVRDSGAILVGAGDSRSPSCFTNYGSRIDMHGWGNNVMTLGYGDRFNPGDENQWYTHTFSGTSSASPIVTGAASSIIGVSLADGQGYGGRTPAEIRKILRDTGTPQVSDPRNIGPLPNLALAIPRILDRKPVASFTINCPGLTCFADASASSDVQGIVNYQWNWGDGAITGGGPTTSHTYGYEGFYSILLTVTDTLGQTSSSWGYVEVVDTGVAPPPAPFFEATGSTNAVTLSWWPSAPGGVEPISYRIQRRSTYNGAWGPEIVTSSSSYVDTQVTYASAYEYRIKAVDAAGQSSDYNWNYAQTVVFGPDVPSGATVLPEHIRDLRDAVDAWRTFGALPQVFPPNPLPATAPYYAHLVTDHSVEPLPGIVNALQQAYSAIGWPAGVVGIFFGVPQPAPGVPVYPEHINQLRELLMYW